MKTNKHQVYINLLALALSGATCFFLFSSHSSVAISLKKHFRDNASPVPESKTELISDTGYNYIHPALFNTAEYPANNYTALRNSVLRFINTNQTSSQVLSTSVYFRDLTSGDWMDCNAGIEYPAGSLMSLPLLISYLRESGAAPSTFSKNDILSDDQLRANTNTVQYKKTFTDLSLSPPTDDSNYTISARDYSRFLWVLYKGLYLANDKSEYACRLLSKSNYREGLLKDIPATVPAGYIYSVSGEAHRGFQLLESAIIYLPGKPYLLTIMTTGKAKELLPGYSAGISGLAFRYLNGTITSM